MERIKLIADTACDISIEQGVKEGIEILPIPITIQGKGYYEGIDFTSEEFYKILESCREIPVTSHVLSVTFCDSFSKAYEEGCTHIICCCINGKGSATLGAARAARETFYEQYEITDIAPRIITYLPKGSIIGRLLAHREAAIVIEAKESGLSQHDAFCWSVSCDDLVRAQGLSEERDRVQEYIQRVLLDRSDEERRRFIDLIFRVMDRLEIRSVSDMSQLSIRQGISGLRELSAMSGEERKFILDVISFLWQQTRSIFFHPRS